MKTSVASPLIIGSFTLLAALAGAPGCGSSSSTTDMGSDASVPDMAVPRDQSTPGDFAGVACGASTCGTGQVCCYSQVPDGGTDNLMAACTAPANCPASSETASAACDGTEDCTGGAFCCLQLGLSKGAPLGGASCTPTCNAKVENSTNTTATTRLCHSNADCAGLNGEYIPKGQTTGIMLGFTSCCATPQLPSLHFCAPPAELAGGAYTCL